MNNVCHKHIEHIFNDANFNALIQRLECESNNDDLKSEVILTMLELDCDKIMSMVESGTLLKYAYGMTWKMVKLERTAFFKKYRKRNDDKLIEYNRQFDGDEIPVEFVQIANELLERKLTMNPNDAHESMIFKKYVELKSCKRVADFFGIPAMHVFQVVKNVRIEIRKHINKHT